MNADNSNVKITVRESFKLISILTCKSYHCVSDEFARRSDCYFFIFKLLAHSQLRLLTDEYGHAGDEVKFASGGCTSGFSTRFNLRLSLIYKYELGSGQVT